MKKLFIACILLSLCLSPAVAQLKGIATYKSDSKIELNFQSSDKMPNANSEEMEKALRKAMQKDYELRFNQKESTWKEVESLGGAPEVASGGMRIAIRESNGILYKNLLKKQSLEESDVFGKEFLVEGALPKYEWKLHNEYKNIGSYKCQKATFTEIRERKTLMFGEEGNEEKTVTDTLNYTAWYTPDVPVSHGPNEYWGLPGLILEVTNGRTSLICSKLVLNPKEQVIIEKPEKGKKISQEEFAEIRDKKIKEMSEQYRGKDGNRVIIRSN